MSEVPSLRLNDGWIIPQLGLGTVHIENAEAETAIPRAVEIGYRLFDTAARYGNEEGIGAGIRKAACPREELFITSKVRGSDQGYDATLRAFDESTKRLGTNYLDLYLIHWPLPMVNLFVETWRALIELQKEGRVRSIGVSNFKPSHIERLIEETGVTPAVNQIQLDPSRTRPEMRLHNAYRDVITQSWSPLDQGRPSGVLHAREVSEIAASLGKTSAQVVLRWHIQMGLVAIPKTANPDRMRENISIFDFELSEEMLDQLATLDKGDHEVDDSDTYYEV